MTRGEEFEHSRTIAMRQVRMLRSGELRRISIRPGEPTAGAALLGRLVG
jgi:hypothetical protein